MVVSSVNFQETLPTFALSICVKGRRIFTSVVVVVMVLRHFCRQALLNDESFEFMEQVEKLRMLKNAENRYALSAGIIDTFIRAGTMKEINIGSAVRDQILVQWEDMMRCRNDGMEVIVPLDFFDDVLFHVITELKADTFPRFKESVDFTQFVRRCQLSNLDLLKRILVNVPPVDQPLYIFPLPDTERTTLNEISVMLTPIDVCAIESLALDFPLKWKIVKADPQFQVSVSIYRYCRTRLNLCNQSPGSVYRITGEVPYSIAQVMCTLVEPSLSYLYDNRTVQSERLHFNSHCQKHDIFSTAIRSESIHFPWPVKTRHLVTANSIVRWKKNGSEKVIIVKKAVDCSQNKSNMFSGWILEKIADGATRYTFVEWCDWRFNKEFVAKCYRGYRKKTFYSMRDNLQKALRRNEELGFPKPQGSRLMDTLTEWKESK